MDKNHRQEALHIKLIDVIYGNSSTNMTTGACSRQAHRIANALILSGLVLREGSGSVEGNIMTNPNFDWIMLLPEEERKAALARRDADSEAFVKGFPVRGMEVAQDAAELHQAGVEGRAAFAKACAQVDRNRTNELVAELRKLQNIIDNQADRILDLEAALAVSNGDQG